MLPRIRWVSPASRTIRQSNRLANRDRKRRPSLESLEGKALLTTLPSVIDPIAIPSFALATNSPVASPAVTGYSPQAGSD